MAKKLTQLGHAVSQPASPDKAKLESVPNPHPDADYLVRFTAPEFTILCPITGQPDFAHFVIDYVPGKALGDGKRGVFVKAGHIAEAVEIKLQRLGFDQCFAWHIIDHEMGEIGLAGDRAQGGEFRGGEAHNIIRIRMRVGDAFQFGLVRRCGLGNGATELGEFFRHYVPSYTQL